MDNEKENAFLSTKDLNSTSHFHKELLNLEFFRDGGDCVVFNISDNAFIGFSE